VSGERRLRLLLVTDEMEVGGTQRQIVTIARALDRRVFDVTVLYFRARSHLVDELEAAGIAVALIPKTTRIDLSFVAALRRFLTGNRFDVLHCFSFTAELWSALVRASVPARVRPALVTSIRGKYEWYSRVHWLLKRLVTAQSDAVVANARAGAAYAARRMNCPVDRIAVIYNGVALVASARAVRAATRAALGLAPDAFAVLFAGRLVDHKDLPTLLRAARKLADDGVALKLMIAGDGPLRSAVEHQIAALGIGERVTLLGERNDIGPLMAAVDALVLPSVREGLSNVILEAMAAELPVVASRAGGNVELIEDGVDGLLFDVGDPAHLARKLAQLATDGALRMRLAQAARFKAATKFSVPAMIERLSALYQQVAKARETPVRSEAAA
jgi:glycosyltransferase involved in cell wall biosynthesis